MCFHCSVYHFISWFVCTHVLHIKTKTCSYWHRHECWLPCCSLDPTRHDAAGWKTTDQESLLGWLFDAHGFMFLDGSFEIGQSHTTIASILGVP